MGNHESPCIVCGENTMTAFNYDCERRHNAKAIRQRIAILQARYGDSPKDFESQELNELEQLLRRAFR